MHHASWLSIHNNFHGSFSSEAYQYQRSRSINDQHNKRIRLFSSVKGKGYLSSPSLIAFLAHAPSSRTSGSRSIAHHEVSPTCIQPGGTTTAPPDSAAAPPSGLRATAETFTPAAAAAAVVPEGPAAAKRDREAAAARRGYPLQPRAAETFNPAPGRCRGRSPWPCGRVAGAGRVPGRCGCEVIPRALRLRWGCPHRQLPRGRRQEPLRRQRRE